MSIQAEILAQNTIHKEWHPIIHNALLTMNEAYLYELFNSKQWLPGIDRLFAAFNRDLLNCHYILFGESPYPRQNSANGIAFYDAAVTNIWSEKGLSKSVNKATSLRNIFKMVLLAEGHLQFDKQSKITQQSIANLDKESLITTLESFFKNLENKGFLLLNATPVLSKTYTPQQEAKFWQPFIESLLAQIITEKKDPPQLILWGKIAEKIAPMPVTANYIKIITEHPYNISFIQNKDMFALFSELKVLQK